VILYFLRHAEAVPSGERLTEAGVEALRAAGTVWQRLNLRPDAVLCSPLPRAVETATLACRALGMSEAPIPDERLAPGADWGAMARSMADRGDVRSVLFVGHEPDLSRAVQLLTGVSSIRMRKGGLACVEFYGVPEIGTGEIAWLLDPDLYEAVAADAG
jgi:phosphohistidine phosphatase